MKKEFKMFPIHGGCIDCTQYDIKGVENCHNCCYFEADWGKPDLSIREPIDFLSYDVNDYVRRIGTKETQKHKNRIKSLTRGSKKHINPNAMDLVSFLMWLDSATIEQLESFGNG